MSSSSQVPSTVPRKLYIVKNPTTLGNQAKPKIAYVVKRGADAKSVLIANVESGKIVRGPSIAAASAPPLSSLSLLKKTSTEESVQTFRSGSDSINLEAAYTIKQESSVCGGTLKFLC